MDGTVVVVGAVTGTAVEIGALVDAGTLVDGALVDAGTLIDVSVVLVGWAGVGVDKSRRSMGGVYTVELEWEELLLVLVGSSNTAVRADVALAVGASFIFARIAWMPCMTLAVFLSVCSRRWLMVVTLACKSPMANTRLVRSSIRVNKCAC